ncbi:putative lipid-transfer protein DIR1 [Corylus avellana]|uniref:putative lipid-transfer protein DIR1 n=1 Tax=Corylus avellana TaxID=13451 RepID=UPI001E205D8C|nr:putative lipid-transfer protein DIR1 [Corylus avellana]
MEMMGIRKMVVMVILMVALFEGSSRAVTLCNMDDDGLAACKPSVTQPTPAEPTPECCKALASADLTCLCSYKNSLVLPALGIDPKLAMELPAKCNLTPPSDC